ncbi:MAG TPA: UrcA family protein [Rhizomicrobium sp.]|jgi:UrcA family protein|nr:UrcA family protein [Rhizomicrobium sp.]
MFRMSTIIAILVLAISAAQADDVSFRIGDLDLSNARDTHVLASRIQSAAAFACMVEKPQAGQTSMFYRESYEQCLSHATRHLISRVMGLSGRVARFASN